MKNYAAEKWSAHVRHVENLEREYWVADGVQERYMADNFQLIIPVTDNDDSDDENCPSLDLPVTSSSCVDLNINTGENDVPVEAENDLNLEQGALDDNDDLDFSYVMFGDNNVIPVDPHVYTSDVHDIDIDNDDDFA